LGETEADIRGNTAKHRLLPLAGEGIQASSLVTQSCLREAGFRAKACWEGQRISAMPNKPKSERITNRPTEDDIAQATLGGSRGSTDLPPVRRTTPSKIKTPPEGDDDPGHTA
jgi:hypothetical protein